MTRPMEPGGTPGPSEYSWGAGLVNPSIINGQPNYGEDLPFPEAEDIHDNWAAAVADRRTDSTDPDSNRDFTTMGNPDRYGANPPLVKESPKKQPPTASPTIPTGVTRKPQRLR